MKKKIAITGGEGFLGRYVYEQLIKHNYSVLLLDKKKHSLFNQKSLKTFLKDIDVIIHLAAKNRDTDVNIFQTNAVGTLMLIEAAKEFCPSARIILASSFQVYNAVNMYSFSKKAAEELLNLQIKGSDLKGTILRIANIYGPGCRPFYNSVIATFIHLIKDGKRVLVNGNGSQKRDYIYVGDVVSAILAVVKYQQKKAIEEFDICTGKLFSLNQVLKLLQKAIQKKVKIVYDKSFIPKEKTINKSFNYAQQKLGWSPKVSLINGLEMSINEKD